MQKKIRVFLATLAFTTVACTTLMSGVASAAPALDAGGKCRDNGKFVAAKMCQTAAPAGGKCRNVQTKKFAKCGTPGTEPVPTSAPAATAPATSAK
jgi:hypothetical protein